MITQRRASIATSDAQCKDPIAGMVRKPRLKPLRSVVEYWLFPDKGEGVQVSGRHSEGVTPVPIPNTAVKPFSADGTVPVGGTGE